MLSDILFMPLPCAEVFFCYGEDSARFNTLAVVE